MSDSTMVLPTLKSNLAKSFTLQPDDSFTTWLFLFTTNHTYATKHCLENNDSNDLPVLYARNKKKQKEDFAPIAEKIVWRLDAIFKACSYLAWRLWSGRFHRREQEEIVRSANNKKRAKVLPLVENLDQLRAGYGPLLQYIAGRVH